MTHKLPTYNLPYNLWRGGSSLADPPDATGLCELVVKPSFRQANSTATVNQSCVLRCMYVPKLTDIRPVWSPAGSDTVEIPAGSGRTYGIIDVDDVAKGFSNEFRLGQLAAVQHITGGAATWPFPIP